MTFTALALSLAFQTAVFDPNETEFQTVLGTLSQNQTLFLQLQGNIYYRGKTTPIVSNLSWSSGSVAVGAKGSKPIYQAEIDESVNGILVKRIVADGNTVWSYNLNTHEYSAIQYGGYGNTRPNSYEQDLFGDLNTLASGPTAYLAKLLTQTYLGSTNSLSTTAYVSWMPGVQSINEGITTFADPVVPGISYTQPASGQIVNYYLYNGAPKRSIVFEITTGNGPGMPDELTNIYFNQIDQLGRQQRLTSWTITPQPSPTFSTYLFRPYTGAQTAGWKAVVPPKATTN